MRRDVTARLTVDVSSSATLVLAVSVAAGYGTAPPDSARPDQARNSHQAGGPDQARNSHQAGGSDQTGGSSERLSVTLDGSTTPVEEVADEHGTRLHVVRADPGRLVVDYTAHVEGRDPATVTRPPTPAERLRYLRPSRYAESDALGPTAFAEFAGLGGLDLLAGVSSWVGTRLAYVPGSSLPTDGAVRTLLARRGVCRDYAHLVVALLRALDVPARVAAVYAPGLDPMDFHAVAEAFVDGAWHVVDATTLAPRTSLVRIATGRDAADTAFLGVYGGRARLDALEVTATADVLPDDDVRALVRLG